MKRWEVKVYSIDGYTCIRPTISRFLKSILPDDHFFMEIAVNEAMNNAFLHGCKKKGCSQVTLKMEIMNDRRCIIRVEDHGTGFGGNQKIREIEMEKEGYLDHRLMHETGRGIYIMYQASDCMVYNRRGNKVMMLKELSVEHIRSMNRKEVSLTL